MSAVDVFFCFRKASEFCIALHRESQNKMNILWTNAVFLFIVHVHGVYFFPLKFYCPNGNGCYCCCCRWNRFVREYNDILFFNSLYFIFSPSLLQSQPIHCCVPTRSVNFVHIFFLFRFILIFFISFSMGICVPGLFSLYYFCIVHSFNGIHIAQCTLCTPVVVGTACFIRSIILSLTHSLDINVLYHTHSSMNLDRPTNRKRSEIIPCIQIWPINFVTLSFGEKILRVFRVEFMSMPY